jgi:hypothetical protein
MGYRAPQTGGNKLRTCLRGAVGMMSAERVDLAIAPNPFVLIAPVGRHHDHGLEISSTLAVPINLPARLE